MSPEEHYKAFCHAHAALDELLAEATLHTRKAQAVVNAVLAAQSYAGEFRQLLDQARNLLESMRQRESGFRKDRDRLAALCSTFVYPF